jgi:two-component system, OmpR family, response regulator
MTTSAALDAPATPFDGIARVLVVDDEPAIRELLSLALGYEGFDVRTAADAAAAVAAAREFRPDAVLLDVMLPDGTGLEVLGRMRADAPALPVMFVTARDAAADRVAGLTAGGDDYLSKPFSLEDLLARLRRLLRRNRVSADDGLLVVGDLVLDEDGHQVTRGGQEVRLSATEFELLRHLMRNAGRVLSRDELFDWVWRYGGGSRPSAVEVTVCTLRRRLGADRPPVIRTVPGCGYVLEPGS